MVDGSLKFDTKIDDKGFKKGLKSLQTSAKGIAKGTVGAISGITKAIAGIGIAAADAATGLMAIEVSTRELRKEMAILEANTSAAGLGMEGMEGHFHKVVALTGETDSAVEGLSNLLAAGFDDNGMEVAVNTLNRAVTAFPDTLKFEGVADGLQESLSTGKAMGQFGELLDRTGVGADNFNSAIAGATTEVEKQQVALDFLTQAGLHPAMSAYDELDQGILSVEEAQSKFNTSLASIGEVLEPASASLLNFASNSINSLVSAFETGGREGLANAAGAMIGGLVNKFTENAPQIMNVALSFLQQFINGIVSNIPLLAPAAADIIVQFISFIMTNLPAVAGAAIDLVSELAEGIISQTSDMGDAASEMVESFASKLTEKAPDLIKNAITLVMSLVDGLIDAAPELIKAALVLIVQLAVGLISAIPQLLAKIPEIIAALVTGIALAVPEMVSAGLGLVTGLWKGIVDNFTKVVLDPIKGLIDLLPKAVKKILGIQSPSKVFAAIGKEIPMGLVKGIDTSKDKALKAAEDLAKETFEVSKDWIDEKKYYNELALSEELEAWGRVKDKYIEGSEQKIEADREYYRVKQEISEEVMKLEEEYNNAVKDRAEELRETYGIFDGVEKREIEETDKLADTLTRNSEAVLERQKAWTDSIAELENRGIMDDAMFAEIQAKGPEYLEEVKAILSMDDDELQEYSDLWVEIGKVTQEQAEKELESLKISTEGKIAEVTGVVETEFDKSPDIGKEMALGLARGILAGESAVIRAAERVARAARAAMSGLSPSAISGSHRSGLNYVPYDGYMAELHKGEMVVTAANAERLRGGGTSTTTTITKNTNQTASIQLKGTLADLAEILWEPLQDYGANRGGTY